MSIEANPITVTNSSNTVKVDARNNFWGKISSVYARWKQQPPITKLDENEAETPKASMAEKLPEFKNNLEADFRWIEDEGLLRDEGVLFGIANSEINEKINAIHQYFDRKTEVSKSLIESTEKSNSQILTQKQEKIAERDRLKESLSVVENTTLNLSPTFIIRNLFGLILIAFGAYGSYYIVHKYLADDFNTVGALGVFLFGLFAQFKPLSHWLKHDEEDAENKWQSIKNTLLEIGTTTAVTLFVGYHIYVQTSRFPESIFTSIFLFFLFLFCGRLILGFINNVSAEIRQIRNAKKQEKNDATREEEMKDRIEQLEGDLKELENMLKQNMIFIEKETSNLKEYPGLSKTKAEIFYSEYKLAKKFSTEVQHEKGNLLQGAIRLPDK